MILTNIIIPTSGREVMEIFQRFVLDMSILQFATGGTFAWIETSSAPKIPVEPTAEDWRLK